MTSPGAVIAWATFGIELHTKSPGVICRLRLAQPRNAARGRIAIGARLAQGLLQLLDHVGRRRQIRIAHAHVDNVGAGIARRCLGAIDLLEDVRWQAADAVEIFHWSITPAATIERLLAPQASKRTKPARKSC
jgi:hypothetical protein